MTLSLLTLRFWNAALFTRRAPDRDQEMAQRVLRDVADHATGALRTRAIEIMETA